MWFRLVFALFLVGSLARAENSTSGAGTPAPPPAAMETAAPSQAGLRPLIQDYRHPPFEAPSFPTANWLRRRFETPRPRVELQPPVRLQDFVRDGKLELTLRSFIELVLANNTDIELQRTQIEVQRNAVVRAFGAFDPVFTANFNATRSNTPTNDALAGAATLSQLNQPANFQFLQTLQSGTQYNVGFQASKLSTNNAFQFFNPALNAALNIGFTQPLLRGRGASIARLPITIARSRYRVSEYQLRDQLIRLLAQAENVYWDVVGARENLRVQEKALELNLESLKRFKRELELGAISPLDIYQPEAQYASSEIQVNQARFRVEQAEDALRRQISADLDPDIRRLPLVLTEPVLPPADERPIDREMKVEIALAQRPDLKVQLQNLQIDDLNIQRAVNDMRPELALTGRYSSSGRGGTFFVRENALLGQSSRVIPGGFGDALDQLFGFNFPTYSFGLQLRLPLRDRVAEANYADAVVNKRLTALRARSLEQQIRQEVLQGVSQVEASKAGVRLAIVARDLAQKQLDAEQKKYELGTTVIFFVLDAQQRLVQQESQLVNQSIQYRRNLINLLTRTGELLEERGIQVQ